jgi:hypothetical protein
MNETAIKKSTNPQIASVIPIANAITAPKEYTVAELLSLTQDLIRNNEALKNEIIDLRNQLKQKEGLPEGYNTKWTWIAKIVFLLKHENKPLRATEMIELFSQFEETFANRKNKIKLLSAYLVKAQQYQKILSLNSKGVRGFYYFLPEWVDENGVLVDFMKRKIL